MFRTTGAISRLAARRALSTAAETPRQKIAQSLLAIKAVNGAANEQALSAALGSKQAVDFANLPPALQHMSGYFSASTDSSAAPFEADKTAW